MERLNKEMVGNLTPTVVLDLAEDVYLHSQVERVVHDNHAGSRHLRQMARQLVQDAVSHLGLRAVRAYGRKMNYDSVEVFTR